MRAFSLRWLLCMACLTCTAYILCLPCFAADLYQAAKILAPAPDATIHDNNGTLSVTVEITPPIHPAGGDYLVVLLDGAEVARGFAHSIELKNIERGSHSLQVQIRAADGALLLASAPQSFQMWRASQLFPGRVPAE